MFSLLSGYNVKLRNALNCMKLGSRANRLGIPFNFVTGRDMEPPISITLSKKDRTLKTHKLYRIFLPNEIQITVAVLKICKYTFSLQFFIIHSIFQSDIMGKAKKLQSLNRVKITNANFQWSTIALLFSILLFMPLLLRHATYGKSRGWRLSCQIHNPLYILSMNIHGHCAGAS